MSFASKPKKIKAKGTLRELKIVNSVSRRGADIVKVEEDKTPRRGTKGASSSSQLNQSLSPKKRQKLDVCDDKPIPCHFEGPNDDKERKTLVIPRQ
jgi:hypothetical protein